jgi:hypothetical protein
MKALRNAVAVFGIFTAGQMYAQIVTFEFSSLLGNEVSASSNFVTTGLNASTLTRGSGLTATNNAQRFNAENWSTGTLDATKYFEFTISAQTGYQFGVTSIDLTHQRSGTGPVTFTLRSSTDNYTSNLGSVTIGDVTTTQASSFSSITLTALSTVTFRVFGSSAEGAGGSWGIGDSSTASANDLVINGAVSAVPEPSTYAAILGAITLVGTAFYRRKRQ